MLETGDGVFREAGLVGELAVDLLHNGGVFVLAKRVGRDAHHVLQHRHIEHRPACRGWVRGVHGVHGVHGGGAAHLRDGDCR